MREPMDIYVLVGMCIPFILLGLLLLMLQIIDYFHEINDARKFVKNFNEKIDFYKLIKDYKKGDKE